MMAEMIPRRNSRNFIKFVKRFIINELRLDVMEKCVKIRFFLALEGIIYIFARFLWRLSTYLSFYGETMYAQK